MGSKSYVNRLKILTDILEAWENNEEVKIIRVNSQNQKVTNKTSRKIRNTNNNIGVENDDDNDDNNEAIGGANNIHDNGDNEDESNDSDSNDDLDNDFNELIKLAETSESNLAEDTFRFENNEDSNTEDLQGFQSTVGINSDRSTFDVNNNDNNEQITACTKELQQSNQNNCRQANMGSPKLTLHAAPKEKQNLMTSDKSSGNKSNIYVHAHASTSTVSESITNTGVDSLLNVIVQPAIKRRGRPRGTDKTVIGLQKKKKPRNEKSIIPFNQKEINDQRKIILKWFLIADETIKKVLNNKQKLCDSDVTIDYKDLTFAILDDTNVNLSIIKPYFTNQGWNKIIKICESKKLQEWECKYCKFNLNKTLEDDGMEKDKKFKISVGCDYCLEWYHLKCAGLERKPKKKL